MIPAFFAKYVDEVHACANMVWVAKKGTTAGESSPGG
jgi:hypothetical protein